MENNKLIALTFDDGPSETTNDVLDILEKYGVKATFFLIGELINEEKIPILKREIELGCEIENHSYTHSDMREFSADEIRKEIEMTDTAIKNAVGVNTHFFRPPYILTSDVMFENVDKAFIVGMGCEDWVPAVSAEQRSQTILDNAKDGTIVLLHDLMGNVNTVKALPTIIEGLRERGFTFVTVEELFERKGINPNQKYKMWTHIIE